MKSAVKLRLIVLLAVLAACSSTTQHKVLSVFFDGVPEPGAAEAVPAQPVELVTAETQPVLVSMEPAAPEPLAAELAARGYSAIDELPLRPVPKVTGEVWKPSDAQLEKATTWEETLRLLPLDIVGGVDWVAAVDQGLYTPQLVLDAGAGAPYTLDTLVAGGALVPGSPFLDFTALMVPEEEPFFEVEFPHSSHTLFLACSSCHPGVQEWDVPMEKILGGQACGQCHGRVSFAAETGCARCHQNLAPPEEAAVETELAAARQETVPKSPELLEHGKGLYQRFCAFCHGESGDGAGRFARYLDTKPRNFQSGTYKFRSTFGPMPTDLDLLRTITRGVPGTSMPAWPALSLEDRWALVHYIKEFSDLFEEEKPGEALAIAEVPDATPELLSQGKDLFKGAGCNSCHGDQGRGNGPSAATLKDNWGQPIRPYNFAGGRPMKSGTGIEAIFRVVMLGLGGTPMPGFGESLTRQQVWSLARYAEAFRGQAPEPFAVRGDILFPRPGTMAGNAPTAPGATASAADGDSSNGDFWGVGDEEDSAPSDEDFWGVGEEEDAAPSGDDFWGVGEEEEEPAGGDDFWGVGEEETVDGGGDSDGDDFWGTEDDDSEADSFWGDDGAEDSAPHAAKAGAAVGSPAGEPELPPAHFPHWFHRIRLKCANCHPRVFEMKKGANPITMDAMRAGLYCAKCHNGKIAWEIGFTNCPRCHQANPGS